VFYRTSSTGGEVIKSQDEPQQITLFSRAAYLTEKNQGYGRSAFNFQHSVRSDDKDWTRITRNYYSVLYGNISMNHDSDWFSVSSGGDEPSRIKDLGELRWSDAFYTPFLPANPRLYSGIRDPRRGESYESSSEERVTKVVVGHLYVVHIKNEVSDFYAMFRVDSLQPSDHCTISWKVVSSPEQ
jgi:hypothetical protein